MKTAELEDWKQTEETMANLKKQIDGAEKLLQQHKTEVGEIRNIANDMKEIAAMKENLKKLIDSADGKSDNNHSTVQSSVGKEAEGGKSSTQVEDLAKKMTKNQKAKADEVFKKLKPEDRIAIKTDPEKRKEFFEAAIEAVSEAPDSLFDNESADDNGGENRFKSLFGLANKEKNFVPGSRNIGANGFRGADDSRSTQESTAKRLPGGKMPRPVPSTQT
jgi:hypothetical protein